MDLADTDLSPSTLLLLWAARETGALDALASDADTPAEVAGAAGIDPRGAELVVDALERAGFLDRVGDAYEPTNRMLGFLADADLRSVGRLPDALDAVDALADLPETLATGDPPEAGSMNAREGDQQESASLDEGDGDRLVNRLGARAATDEATTRAVTTAALRAAPDAETVVDARGAPGHYAKAFAALGRAVVLADRPDAVERSTPLLAPTAVDAVDVENGDPLPDGDLVFAGDVARWLDPASAEVFVDRLASAAAPDGTVVVADVLADRSPRATPADVVAYARTGGGAHEAADYADWFAAADLGDPEVRSVPGTDRQVVVGHVQV